MISYVMISPSVWSDWRRSISRLPQWRGWSDSGTGRHCSCTRRSRPCRSVPSLVDMEVTHFTPRRSRAGYDDPLGVRRSSKMRGYYWTVLLPTTHLQGTGLSHVLLIVINVSSSVGIYLALNEQVMASQNT